MATKKKSTGKKKKANAMASRAEQIRSEVFAILWWALAVLTATFVFSKESAGAAKVLREAMFVSCGTVGYLLPFVFVYIGIMCFLRRKEDRSTVERVVAVFTVWLLMAFVHMLCIGALAEAGAPIVLADTSRAKFWDYVVSLWKLGSEQGLGLGGGILGGCLYYLLHMIFGGGAVAGFLICVGLLVCLMLSTRISIHAFAANMSEKWRASRDRADEDDEDEEEEVYERPRRGAKAEPPTQVSKQKPKQDAFVTLKPKEKAAEEDTQSLKSQRATRKHIPFDEAFVVPPRDESAPPREGPKPFPQSGRLEKKGVPEPFAPDPAPPFDMLPPPSPPKTFDGPLPAPVKKKKEDELPVIPANAEQQRLYIPPAVEYLTAPGARRAKGGETPETSAKLLEETLDSFGIQARVLRWEVGPSVTRFELQPAPGVRVNRITALHNDIALALAAQTVRIEAPIPGKAAVGIEIPNKNTVSVVLRDIIDSKEFRESTSPLTMALGKGISGKIMVADLAKMPHMLIAGATGSGKSVCINALIISMIYKSAPKDLRLILIDPKMVELSVYATLPHLMVPVVTEPKKAAGALHWAVNEMMNRYQKFKDVGAKDLARYNAMQTDELNQLPKLVVVIDELADLMMVSPQDVEDSICRIAQLGRACGIHLLVATQRPSADIITGLIKANIPSRCAFAVSSAIDSRIILDRAGAEKLLGRGDMLFHPNGAGEPMRLQGAFVGDEEVEKIMKHFRNTEPVQFDANVISAMESAGNPDAEGAYGQGKQEDDLLGEAVRVVLEKGEASISMLQRRLRVGYARAARLVDIMEQNKYVSEGEGSKPRKVLITRAEYYRLFGEGGDILPPEDAGE
ncbi:MAG: FtsK/SpoIIIE domain-containing protein [Clostridiales bacterium]|nr:FtsK/SpoIIIE domain-containing protein [Clostridiales bacterium]